MTPDHDPSQLAQLEAWFSQLPDPVLDEETARILKERVRAELAAQSPDSYGAPAAPPDLRLTVQAAVRAELERTQRLRLPRQRRWLAAAAVLLAATGAAYWQFHPRDFGHGVASADDGGDLLALETDLADLELSVCAMDYVLFDAPSEDEDEALEIEQLSWPRYQMNF